MSAPATSPETIARFGSTGAILDVVRRTTGMGFAAIAQVTDDAWTACAVSDGLGFGMAPGDSVPAEASMCVNVRRTRRPLAIGDIAADPHWAAHPIPLAYGLGSYIGVPIILADNTVFGTLCAHDITARDITRPELTGMFALFADLIAAHLDASARREAEEAALVDARSAAELREQIIAVLGHDLRNPLASVDAGLRLITKRGGEPDPRLLGQMRSSVDRMAELISNVLDFARGKLGGGLVLDIRPDPALALALEQVIEEIRTARPDALVSARIDLPGVVRCDRARLAQLLSNLLANALRHAPEGSPVRVEADMHAGVFRLSVVNAGEAIPAEMQARLFEPFFRAPGNDPGKGLGLGLYIATQIARAHGGDIALVSDSAETRFTLTMPAG